MGWLDTVISAGKNVIKDNAGQIASGVAGAVLGNKGGESTKSGTTVETMPSWMTDYAQRMLQQSASIGATPYTAYGGPRVAGLTKDQQDAANMVRANTGQAGSVIANAMGMMNPNAGQGNLAKAAQYMDAAGGSWLDNSTRFMDDYKANVINPATSQAMRTWREEINPGIQSDFSGAKGVGAFGSDAMLRHTLRAGSDLTEKLNENNAAYLDRGYSQGMGQFNTENSNKGQLSQIARSLGQTEFDINQTGAKNQANLADQWADRNTADAQALSNVGEQQRQIDQAAMDADFQEWGRAQGYSQAQLDDMLKTLQGVQGATGKTVNTTGSEDTNDSPLKNAAAAIALYNSIKGTGDKTSPTAKTEPSSMPAPKARGGLLRKISRRVA